MNIQKLIEERATQAFHLAGVGHVPFNPVVRQSAKVQFGDYQINGVMGIAKQFGFNPREFAQQVLQHLDLKDIATRVDIAGPGFINIFLDSSWLEIQAQQQLCSENLNITLQHPQRIVVDYSSPNVAKEMHVGHLRSTIIGDAVVRTLEFLGHHVIRVNHIGDWGTQFGMLIANLERIEQQCSTDKKSEPISMKLSDLESFYRESKVRYDSDESFAARARQYVVKLQSGDRYCLDLWKKLVDITLFHNQENYERLSVSLTINDVMGESIYNGMLTDIVADLKHKGLAIESDGATVVYLDEYKTKDGDPMGVIIQKKDGGFLYTTTDIACAKYRYEVLHADRILYFVDSRQHQHLQQAWSIVRKAGYVPESVPLEHHAFGMMLGKDGRPFKTRTGGTVRLTDLLDEAEKRALDLINSKQSSSNHDDYSNEQMKNRAHVIGIGAVKYADLSKNRMTDYIFDWDNMLSFEGNTAPYMQYAYARISSIFRKSKLDKMQFNALIKLEVAQERQLVCALLQFEETLFEVAKTGEPHLICTYLYHITGLFSRFYESCPIMKLDDELVKNSRLAIAALTAKIIKQCLELLGIETLEQM